MPRLSSEGLVEYGVTVVQGQESPQHGPDLDWILKGSGPLSQPSAGGRVGSQSRARRSRVDSGGTGALKPRTPSLPPMGSRPEQRSVGKIRSTSLYDNTMRVIPDIVKHSAPPPLSSEDREEPCDLEHLLTSTPSPAPQGSTCSKVRSPRVQNLRRTLGSNCC